MHAYQDVPSVTTYFEAEHWPIPYPDIYILYDYMYIHWELCGRLIVYCVDI